MGPESAQGYPGVEVLHTAPGPGQPAGRARQEVDYGRRGKGYIFGAFEPGEGRAFTLPYPGRTTANWVDFLQAVDGWVGPEPQAVFAIIDNLSTHRAADVLLFSLTNPRWHFAFQPTYAAYLNLMPASPPPSTRLRPGSATRMNLPDAPLSGLRRRNGHPANRPTGSGGDTRLS